MVLVQNPLILLKRHIRVYIKYITLDNLINLVLINMFLALP